MPPTAVLGLIVMTAAGAVAVAALDLHGRFMALYLAIELGVVIVGLARLNTLKPYDPLGPTGFPLAYTVFTLTSGTIIAVTIGFSDTFLDRTLISSRLLLVQGLFSVSLLAGMMFSRSGSPRMESDTPRKSREFLLIHFGTLSLAAAAAYPAIFLLRHGPGSWNTSRGVDFTFTSQLALVSSLLPLLALLCILLGDHAPRRLVIPTPALVLLGMWVLTSLAIGSRDEVLAPAIILAWAYHRRVRPLRGWVIIALTVVGFTLLGLVGVWRSQATQHLSIASLVRPTASGVNTTAETIAHVPGQSPYVRGQTYRAALRAGLPFVSISAADPVSRQRRSGCRRLSVTRQRPDSATPPWVRRTGTSACPAS